MPGRVGEARETDSQRSAPDGAVGRLARRSATAGVDIEGWCPPHKALGPSWQHEHPGARGGPDRSTPIDQQVRSRSEEHTSELQSLAYLVCRLLLEKKKTT